MLQKNVNNLSEQSPSKTVSTQSLWTRTSGPDSEGGSLRLASYVLLKHHIRHIYISQAFYYFDFTNILRPAAGQTEDPV